MRVLVFGDSITQGFWYTEGGWVARLRKHYDNQSIESRSYDEPTIFNLGISGETTTDLLKRFRNEIEARVRPSEEFCLIIAIGTNDNLFESSEQWTSPDRFKENIEDLISIAKEFSKKILFFGSNSVDEKLTVPVSWGDFNYTNKEMKKYEDIIGEVCRVNRVNFIPLFERFEAGQAKDSLLSDGLHPNDAGHELMFKIIQPELDKLIKG